MVEVQVVASARADAVLELNHIHAHQVIGRVVGFAVNIELYVADGDVWGGELGAVGCWGTGLVVGTGVFTGGGVSTS